VVKKTLSIYVYLIGVNLWSQKDKMGPIMLAALTGHYTPTTISYNGTQWINMENLLFCKSCAHQDENMLSPYTQHM
jgi:hypothetical protein